MIEIPPDHDFDPEEHDAWLRFQAELDARHHGSEYRPPDDDDYRPNGNRHDTDDGTSVLRSRLIRGRAILELPAPEPIIDGVLYRDTLGLLYGAPKDGKTFAALALSLSIVSGRPWLGRTPAARGPVLYIIGEGAHGASPRVDAWLGQHGYTDADIDTITFHNGAINLTNQANATTLAIVVAELQPVAIVIDTLARCAPAAEESTAAMNELIAVCDYLRRICGSTILIVHHSGKDITKGPRGPIALLAASDTAIRCTKAGVELTLRCEAQRDAEPFEPIYATLEGHRNGSAYLLTGMGSATSMVEGAAQVLAAIRESDDGTGLSASAWFKACDDLPERSFYRRRKVLVDGGFVRCVGAGRGARYYYVERSEE